MASIKCPECGKDVSDEAIICKWCDCRFPDAQAGEKQSQSVEEEAGNQFKCGLLKSSNASRYGSGKGKITLIVGAILLVIFLIFVGGILSLILGLMIACPLIILGFLDWRREIWLRKNPMSCNSCNYSGTGKIVAEYSPQTLAILVLFGVFPAYFYIKSRRKFVCPKCGSAVALKDYMRALKEKE